MLIIAVPDQWNSTHITAGRSPASGRRGAGVRVGSAGRDPRLAETGGDPAPARPQLAVTGIAAVIGPTESSHAASPPTVLESRP